MSNSLAGFFTAITTAMEGGTLGYHYAEFDFKGTPSSQIDKAYFVEDSLSACTDESGRKVMKRRAMDVSFAYHCGAGLAPKTIALAAYTELEKVEDALLVATNDWVDIGQCCFEKHIVSNYLLARITLMITYRRDL